MDSNYHQKNNLPNMGFDPVHKILLVFGATGPGVTYLLAISPFSSTLKIAGLTLLALVYLGVCIWAYNRFRENSNAAINADHGNSSELHDTDQAKEHIALRLQAIEEAREFFGASLKSADMFRLVSSRVRELIPFNVSILLLPAEDGSGLEAFHFEGSEAATFEGNDAESSKSISGLAFLSGEPEIDPGLVLEKGARPNCDLSGLLSSAAIPLKHEGAVFGVFQMFSQEQLPNDNDMRELLNQIGEKIGPLFLSARSVDRSMTSALIDPLTKLPNERALFMVLENQLAESHRLREERPLSVLAIDIKGFEIANREYGHVNGDNILRYAAEQIASKLRKMDFLVRASGDEFLVVLPTAHSKMANEILQRVIAGFDQAKYEISDGESVNVKIHTGVATFWQDGETAEELIRQARQRKQIAKSEEKGKVVRFSKEYIN